MKRVELTIKGFVPFVLGIIYMMFGMLLEIVTDNRMAFDLMSIGVILFWGCLGHEIGKESGASLKSVLYVHIVSILVVAWQIFMIIQNTMQSQYTPSFFSQLFFLPAGMLLANFVNTDLKTIVIYSFVLMIIVFTIGMFIGSRLYNSKGDESQA